MTPAELREAVGFVMESANKYLEGDGTHLLFAAVKLAKWYEACHPADDAEPVTMDWLESVFGPGLQPTFMGDEWDRWSIKARLHYGGSWVEVGKRRVLFGQFTRGEFRTLCKLLGLTLKEAATP
jgi:hypothetical protein